MSHNTFWLYSYPILSPLIPSRFTPHTHTYLLPTLWYLFFIVHQVQTVHIHGCLVSSGGIPGIFKIKADSPSPRSHYQLSLAPWSAVVLISSSPLQAWMLTVLILWRYYSGGHCCTRSRNAQKTVFPSGPPPPVAVGNLLPPSPGCSLIICQSVAVWFRYSHWYLLSEHW